MDAYGAGKIIVVDPYSRALPPISRNGAVYMVIINDGQSGDQLIGATTPIARNTEIHTHTMENGMAKMRMVNAVDLPPHTEVIFEPSGHHIMLVGLLDSLRVGEKFPLILHFRDSGNVAVVVKIRATDGSLLAQNNIDPYDSVIVGYQPKEKSNAELSVTVSCAPTNARFTYRCRIQLLDNNSGYPVDDAEFTVSTDMPAMRGAHSQKGVPVQYESMGIYYVDLKFEMIGEWEFKLKFSDLSYSPQLLQLIIAS
tara:strand:+ start:1083 stop:1844 length:762 start_codon:yes stop_codon:yes gene_type:complete